jgi:hypothetical protein
VSRAYKHTSLPPPYLKRIWIDEAKVPDGALYPFCLPLFRDPGFELFRSARQDHRRENGFGTASRPSRGGFVGFGFVKYRKENINFHNFIFLQLSKWDKFFAPFRDSKEQIP